MVSTTASNRPANWAAAGASSSGAPVVSKVCTVGPYSALRDDDVGGHERGVAVPGIIDRSVPAVVGRGRGRRRRVRGAGGLAFHLDRPRCRHPGPVAAGRLVGRPLPVELPVGAAGPGQRPDRDGGQRQRGGGGGVPGYRVTAGPVLHAVADGDGDLLAETKGFRRPGLRLRIQLVADRTGQRHRLRDDLPAVAVRERPIYLHLLVVLADQLGRDVG